MSTALQILFDKHCGLTCKGGSERRGCICKGPVECPLTEHPGFVVARQQATKRMVHTMQKQNKFRRVLRRVVWFFRDSLV